MGIVPVDVTLRQSISEQELVQHIETLNKDPTIDGILVQMPLPSHIDTWRVIEAICPAKDIDGLHPYNVGKLTMLRSSNSDSDYAEMSIPCTPKAILHLLDEVCSDTTTSMTTLEGKVAVVVGRSNLVGIPVAQLLRQRNCTVVQCHSQTVDLANWVRQADVVVAACGVPEMIRGDWIRHGAVVIDVGINFVADRIVGDVCYDEAVRDAAAITPVPGGVGPVTIAMLLQNVVDSFERRVRRSCQKTST